MKFGDLYNEDILQGTIDICLFDGESVDLIFSGFDYQIDMPDEYFDLEIHCMYPSYDSICIELVKE